MREQDSLHWWHYTLGTTLLKIIAAQKITRASAGLLKGERPAVWFSRRVTWEPTATKGVRDHQAGLVRDATIPEMVAMAGTLVRIEVAERIARHTFVDHRRLGRIDPRAADALELSARSHGADPDEWRVSYHDVPIAGMSGVEASDDGTEWRPVGRPCDGRSLILEQDFIDRVRAALAGR